MILQMQFLAFFLFQIVLIYFISRQLINELFYSLNSFIGNKKIVYNLIAVFFLPGTVIHEISHFFAAVILLLRVRSVSILPEWKGNYLKLGSVVYEKKDIFRSILVGISPLFGGLAFFWFLAAFKIFPQNSLGINILLGYLIFSVASNMFSSAKDLQDLIFIIPFGLIAAAIIYIFNIRVELVFTASFWQNIINIFQKINNYLLISLGLNLGLLFFLKITRFLTKK